MLVVGRKRMGDDVADVPTHGLNPTVKPPTEVATTSTGPSALGYLIGSVFNAGVSYLAYKHDHPYVSYFFAASSATLAILAANKESK